MMSAPHVAAAPSPFRSPGGGQGGAAAGASVLRTSPWPTAAHAPDGFGRFAVGGSVYSLFPSVPSATEASAIYSHSSGSPGARFGAGQSATTTFHSFLGTPQKGDTLFSAGFPLTPTSIPSSSPQALFSTGSGLSPAGLSPALGGSLDAERGISQLELMARGYSTLPQMAQPPPTRRVEEEKRVEPPRRAARGGREKRPTRAEKNRAAKEDAQKAANERVSCSCPVSKSTCTATSVNAAHAINHVTTSTSMATFASSSPPFHCAMDAMTAASLTAFHPPNMAPIFPTLMADTLSGCSRTNPVPPRSRSTDSSGRSFSPMVIKKEAGTPCQVDEVTTSKKEKANASTPVVVVQAIKSEPNEEQHAAKSGLEAPLVVTLANSAPSSSAAHTASNIPVGIAVARQRSSSPGRLTSEEVCKAKSSNVQEKPRDDFRVLLPARRAAPAPLAPAPAVTATTVINTMAQAVPTSAPAALMVHPQERTATLMTSSIVLQPPPASATGPAGAAATLQVHTTGGEDAVTQALAAARLSNGLPPWASHSASNSALTPPTLWLGQPQYPTGPTVQIEAAPPPSLPPVGLQLVRDPMSGHLILLPATNIDHVQRALQVWPNNTTTTTSFPQAQTSLPQLMLPQANGGPGTQHITVFPQQNDTEFRILLPPQHLTQQNQPPTQLALVHEPMKQQSCKKDVMEAPKIELIDTSKLIPADLSGAQAAQFPTSFMFPAQTANQGQQAQQPATQVQYFYEQITGTTVQISSQQTQQAPPPTAVTSAPAVLAVDTGRRSQATSPANPAEVCLTPPPETISPTSCQNESNPPVPTSSTAEESHQESAVDSSSPEEVVSSEAEAAEVKVQDASNQTETPPVSEDEVSRDAASEEDVHEEQMLEIDCKEPEQPVVEEMISPETTMPDEQEPEVEEEVHQVEQPEPQPPPVDLSGLELLSNSIEQFVEREKEAEKQSAVVPQNPHMIGGLGLLCALAEQRFFEDMEQEKVEQEEPAQVQQKPEIEQKREEPVTPRKLAAPEKIDVNRNYKSPSSEKNIKKFIASKVSQYAENGGSSQASSSEVHTTEYIDAMELDLRMRLADLQKKYKAKQKELSKLQHPRRNSVVSDDSCGSPNKRGPGRPRKRKLSPVPSPKKAKIPKEAEKEEAAPSKSKPKDILKPPTLNTNKILTSPKFKPSMSEKFRPKVDQEKSPKDDDVSSSSDGSSPGSSWLSGGFSSFKKSADTTQIKPSAFTFGTKMSAPLVPAAGEKQRFQPLAPEPLFWFLKPDKENSTSLAKTGTHQFGELPSNGFKKNPLSSSEPESDQEGGSPSLLLPNSTTGAGGSSSSSSSCSSCSSSSSKKRKPGRPKRRTPGKSDQTSTETIVAKKRSISFLLNSTSFASSTSAESRPKIKPKLKAEIKMKTTRDEEDDTWSQRSEPSTPPAGENSPTPWTSKPVVERERPRTIDAAQRLGAKKRPSTGASSKSPVAKQRSNSTEIKAKKICPESKIMPRTARKQMSGSSSSERPLKRPSMESCSSVNGHLLPCTLNPEDLAGEPRALRVMGGLVYAGQVTAIRAPDLYGITLDGERGNRPHILSREEALKELIREVQPSKVDQVLPGTRICAYWSQQSRCLYPGTVAEPSSPDANLDICSVNVEFDDGDSGRITLEDIRMLPSDYPVVEYDPNPLLSLAKRRRAASGASSTEGRRTSSETPLIPPTESIPKSPSPVTVTADSTKKDTETGKRSDGSSKHLSDEERERKKLKKKEKARKKEKMRKLLAQAAMKNKISGHKKHKKHHHKHHHHRKKHKHRKHGDKEMSSSATSDSSTTPEVVEASPPPQEPEMEHEEEAALHDEKKAKQSSPKKRQERQSSSETKSKMAAFLPARQLWKWSGKGYKRPGGKGRGKKEFFKSIQRGKETINVGDCAVFLSTGRPDRPYIGRIETMWESWGGNMVVRVKWFYHPEETQGGGNLDKLKYPGALFQSPHADENDVQTISHKCEVIPLAEYTKRLGKEPSRYATIYDNNDIYYLAGHYDPSAGVLTMEPGVI